MNLAIALSMVEKKVLLVDADLRKRRLSSILKLSHSNGITDVLTGIASIKDSVNIMTYKNLHFLSTGSKTTTPAEVFASVEFDNLIKELEPLYDYIIFDAPPINVVSDALPIIKNSDGVLFIVRENLSTHKDLKESLAALELINANILGLVYLGNSATQPYYNRKSYRKYKAYYDGYGD
jgi:capsular exopolysaccharide synthesis family protein